MMPRLVGGSRRSRKGDKRVLRTVEGTGGGGDKEEGSGRAATAAAGRMTTVEGMAAPAGHKKAMSELNAAEERL